MNSEVETRKLLVEAIAALRLAAQLNLDRTTEILDRLDHFEVRIEAGDSTTNIVTAEASPRIVEMLSQNMATLETSGAAYRSAQARRLHHEGMTMEVIADLFGVSRQRISAILRS